MVNRNDSTSNHINITFEDNGISCNYLILQFMWIFPSYFLLTVKKGKGKGWWYVAFLPYLTQKRTVEQFRSLPGCLSSSCFQDYPDPRLGWNWKKTPPDIKGWIDIKRWARLDPAAIVRCGQSHSQQALRSFYTVTGASGLLDTLALHISSLGGAYERAFNEPLVCWLRYAFRERAGTLKTSRSVVAVG